MSAETPTKPALPLELHECDDATCGYYASGAGCDELTPAHLAWLNACASAHGPALKAMRAVVDELASLVDDEECDHDVNICWCESRRKLSEARDALALMEQAPEPEP